MLQIAPTLELPLEAVTQTFAVLGMRGVGKSYTTMVMAEEMLGAGQQVVVVDPIGVYWGLRTSADGKSPGLPIVIAGGDHGDIPIQDDAGELVADLVIDQGVSMVLDLSHFRKAASRRFMTSFLETLYHRNRAPLHLIVDEADAFAPQRPQRDATRLLGAMEDIVRRGRARGLGITMATQRAAVLNKDVLTQTSVLIALRMVGRTDIAAVDAWVSSFGGDAERDELMSTIASLPVGHAWFWSPGWLGTFQQIEVRERRTFDSSATPEVGAAVTEPAARAEVDLDVIRERMASLIEEHEENDPKILKRRIADLERQLSQAEPETVTEVVTERIEVPVLESETVERVTSAIEAITENVLMLAEVRKDLNSQLAAAQRCATTGAIVAEKRAPARKGRKPERSHLQIVQNDEKAPDLPDGARRMMAALYRANRDLDRSELGTLSGMASRGGTFGTYLSKLRSANLIQDQGNTVQLSSEGERVCRASLNGTGPFELDEIVRFWDNRLAAGARRMLDELIAVYPDSLSRRELGELSGIAASGGTFGTYLSRLRSYGLIEDAGGGEVRAHPILFIGQEA